MDEQVEEMRRVWRGEPVFDGADEIGPVSPQGASIPLYAGVMMPKAIARAAKWADGIYGTSMAGDREGHQHIFDMAKAAWAEEGRTSRPYLIGSFWCSLSPNAETDLKTYTYEYMKYQGDEIARHVARSMTRHSPDAVRKAIENVREAGADELLICPATVHYDEIDRLAEIVAAL